jgi:predicted nucleotidyltransferase
VLYGSVARGMATPESDIDLLVILRDASFDYFKRLQPLLEAWRALERSPQAATLRQR